MEWICCPTKPVSQETIEGSKLQEMRKKDLLNHLERTAVAVKVDTAMEPWTVQRGSSLVQGFRTTRTARL